MVMPSTADGSLNKIVIFSDMYCPSLGHKPTPLVLPCDEYIHVGPSTDIRAC